MKNKKKLLLTLASLATFSYADDSVSDNDIMLSEVQVIGSKESEEDNSVTYRDAGNAIPSLSTYTPTDTIRSTTQDLMNMGGVSIMGSSQPMSQELSIGGLMSDNIWVSIDGLNNYFTNFGHNQTNQFISPYLFKQVTATQTGSNITYGSGNVGGAVNFTTIDPEDLLKGDELSTQTTIGYVSGTNGVNGNAAIAAKTGNVSYLLDIVASHDNDMYLGGNNGLLQYSANNDYQLLGKIGIDISSSQKLKLSFLGMENTGQYPATVSSIIAPTNPPTNFTFSQNQSALDYSYDPNNDWMKLNAKLSYQTSSLQSTPISSGDGFALAQSMQINTIGAKVNNETKIVEQNLLYGADYTNIQGTNQYADRGFLEFPDASQQLYGFYLQDSWDVTKTINLTAGTRYNTYQSNAGNLNNGEGLFTNQFAINYNFLPEWTAFAGYAEGFRAPTIQELYLAGNHAGNMGPVTVTQLANPNLKTEIGRNKTIGIKYSSKLTSDQTLDVAATGFLNNVSNYILNTYVERVGMTYYYQNINISAVELSGYTLSARYTSPWVIADANFTNTYGITKSAYQAGATATYEAGTALPIPQATGYVGLGFPINSIDSIIKPMVNYAINQPMTAPTAPDVNGYVLLGLMYQWMPKNNSMKGMQVTVGVDNILNEDYQTFNGFNTFPGMGRSAYAQVGYKY
ncbi:MAG: TonB-dependent receptor [Burkholderiales bacterium]|nr:TonB-dependent receptor [Burkholderiales bacterium]